MGAIGSLDETRPSSVCDMSVAVQPTTKYRGAVAVSTALDRGRPRPLPRAFDEYPHAVADATEHAMTDRVAEEAGARRRVPDDVTPAVYGSLLVTTLVAVQWRHDVSTT